MKEKKLLIPGYIQFFTLSDNKTDMHISIK